jgi:DNA integrity scanning protein DisA with diadenylate cyclase activity
VDAQVEEASGVLVLAAGVLAVAEPQSFHAPSEPELELAVFELAEDQSYQLSVVAVEVTGLVEVLAVDLEAELQSSQVSVTVEGSVGVDLEAELQSSQVSVTVAGWVVLDFLDELLQSFQSSQVSVMRDGVVDAGLVELLSQSSQVMVMTDGPVVVGFLEDELQSFQSSQVSVMTDGVVVAGLVEVVSQSFHPGSVMVMTVLHSSHVSVITVYVAGLELVVVIELPQSSQFPVAVDEVVAGLVVLLELQSSQPPV